jgi:guanine deaminase
MYQIDTHFLDMAVVLAENSAVSGGGPFAAIVVMPGLSDTFFPGTNSVTLSNDPTAHAEVNAIRSACEQLKTHELTGAVLYTSCAPCPMCLAAALWARIDTIVFAAMPEDAKAAGFDDAEFYHEVIRVAKVFGITDAAWPPLMSLGIDTESTSKLKPFEAWRENKTRVNY